MIYSFNAHFVLVARGIIILERSQLGSQLGSSGPPGLAAHRSASLAAHRSASLASAQRRAVLCPAVPCCAARYCPVLCRIVPCCVLCRASSLFAQCQVLFEESFQVPVLHYTKFVRTTTSLLRRAAMPCAGPRCPVPRCPVPGVPGEGTCVYSLIFLLSPIKIDCFLSVVFTPFYFCKLQGVGAHC